MYYGNEQIPLSGPYITPVSYATPKTEPKPKHYTPSEYLEDTQAQQVDQSKEPQEDKKSKKVCHHKYISSNFCSNEEGELFMRQKGIFIAIGVVLLRHQNGGEVLLEIIRMLLGILWLIL
jgi:hypothetical protein